MIIEISKLNINDGDVLLIDTNPTPYEAQRIYETFRDNGYGKCVLLFGFEESDIKTLDEEAMKELGWVKVNDQGC